MTLYSPSFTNPSELGGRPAYGHRVRSDSAIEEEIWARLSKESPRLFSPDHIAVEVNQGQVHLSGHVAEEAQRQLAQKIASQVNGVTQVRNAIVPDRDLRVWVLQALSKDERTSLYLVPVKCTHGWISLGGIVPTPEAANVIEGVAASVPEVRGILGIPWVVGLSWTRPGQVETDRRAFQPRIGAGVHTTASDGVSQRAGSVIQVILSPHSRLLTHLVVQVREKSGERQPNQTKRILPVSAIEAANGDNVWLKDGEAIEHYPVFHPHHYPRVPQDWRPPFPYTPEMVRWSGQ